MADLIIVNNGSQDIERTFGAYSSIKILNPGKNLGWEGGLELGLKESNSPFVVFQNDDTYLTPGGCFFYQRLLTRFQDDNVAAVGPVTTCALGRQSVYSPDCPNVGTEVSYLIFFTVMLRRKHLEEVGGIDTSLPGGDDFDLSIRLRAKGYNLVIDPGAFIIHHGFKTGERIKGDPSTSGGWNSVEMTERTNQALIRKHGFKTWWKTISGLKYQKEPKAPDLEGDLVRSFVNGDKRIVELGCGHVKTIERAIGVDRISKGERIPHLRGALSVADVVANVEDPLPFEDNSQDVLIARHILEHILLSVRALKDWKRVLRPGGKIILAVPDQRVTSCIPLNPEHLSAHSEDSMKDMMEALGWETVETRSAQNGVSFVGVFRKPSKQDFSSAPYKEGDFV